MIILEWMTIRPVSEGLPVRCPRALILEEKSRYWRRFMGAFTAGDTPRGVKEAILGDHTFVFFIIVPCFSSTVIR